MIVTAGANMNFKLAYETYALQLYEWSLGEFKHEIEFDFPILRTVENRTVQALICVMDQFNDEDKQNLAAALVRSAHRSILRKQGIMPVEQDELWLKNYRLRSALCKDTMPSKVNSPLRTDFRRLTPKKASQAILNSWSAYLRTEAVPAGRRVWVFSNQINADWAVKTQIGIYSGGNTGGVIIDYMHIVDRCDYEISYEKPAGLTNYLSTLGVARNWDILYQDELEITEKSLMLALSRFMESLPELLDGLSRKPNE